MVTQYKATVTYMANFEASSDARFMAKVLANANPGEIVTYEMLSEAIGRDVRRFAASALFTAVKMQLRERRVFECIRGVGYKLLEGHEIVRTQGEKAFNAITNKARSAVKKIAAADYSELNNDQKVKHNAQISMLGAICHMTKPKALENVENAVIAAQNKELPVGNTLALFVGK